MSDYECLIRLRYYSQIIDCNKKQTTCYGEELCTYLASFNSKLAIKNADNYEMYLETFRNM